MAIPPVPLYLGKCLEDLEKIYETIPDCRGKKLKMLLESANTLHKSAEQHRLAADQEQSYVYYMRYFKLISIIRQNPDYGRNKQFVTQLLGGRSRQNIAMDNVTSLSNALKIRYEKENSTKSLTINNSINMNSNSLMDSKNNGSKSSIGGIIDDDDDNKPEFQINIAISCENLYKMIKKQNPCESLLIMDCRSEKDFMKSRLHFSSCLNVPQEILLLGMSAGKIQQKLEEKSRALWASRSVKDNVVLMDWDCKDANSSVDSPIIRLKQILINWDPDTTYKSPIRILDGGYERLILMYPTICTNPNVENPMKPNEMEYEAFDDIEYPSINNITMKDDTIFNNDITLPISSRDHQLQTQFPRPSIDRTTKIAAQKIYDEKEKGEILKEREALLNKSLENNKILLKSETQWQNISNEVDRANSIEERKMLLDKHQKLLYTIYQLEDNGRDIESENERLNAELEAAGKREQSFRDKISEMEAKNIKLVEERIQEKLKQQQAIEEQRELERKERMKQLEIAKEQKRHMKPPSEEDISKAKIPQYDRSVKPIVQKYPHLNETSVIQRDFSPIRGSQGRGLTGLKNLGNTCYMNSIMQCLSNTGTLTEYFVSNNYKIHVNHENKTKGKIVEEVAALIKILWNGQYKCVASKDLRYVIGQYQQIFSGIEQQDSHEFLTILMDWLHSDLQTLKMSESPRRDNLRAAEKSWLEFTKSCESYILQLFYGQIKSTVKCKECSKESATYECFSNLSLELPGIANRCQIDDCLNLYFNGELIRGWNCPNCKQKRDAIKKLSVSKLPPILVIHLKRFYADSESSLNTYKKKHNYVNFPLERLDMTLHIAKSETRSSTPKTYNLYGVSNHYGSMESGHYTAFCKSTIFNKWFKYDDTTVSSLDSSDVVSSAAYILFYTNLPLSSPFNNEI